MITGLGVVSAAGRGPNALWSHLLEASLAPGHTHLGGALRDYTPPPNLDSEAASRLGRTSLLAADAAIQAVEDARLPFTAQTAPLIGVVFGSELGEAEKPVVGAPATSVARVLGVAGPLVAIAGPSSGALALAEAAEIVRRGEAPVVVAGAADALLAATPDAPVTPSGVPRPFDVDRDGLLLAEGAAAVVLEASDLAEDRGAVVYGEVLGHGNCFSRATVMQPAPNFLDATRAMRAALLRAEVFQGEIEVVFASATGSLDGDAIEVRALKDLWGPNVDRLTVTSVHGALGFPLAAAAPISVVAALLSLREAVVPGTAGLREVDADFRQLDIVRGEARKYRWDTAMVNAFGAGANVALVLRSAQ